jgi:hypothetical protein
LDPKQWNDANRRRLTLIERRFAGGLAAAEEEELQRLQELADRQLEELDAQMLDDVARMEAIFVPQRPSSSGGLTRRKPRYKAMS